MRYTFSRLVVDLPPSINGWYGWFIVENTIKIWMMTGKYWLVVDLALWKIWVRQIGSSSQHIPIWLGKIKFMFQSPPSSQEQFELSDRWVLSTQLRSLSRSNRTNPSLASELPQDTGDHRVTDSVASNPAEAGGSCGIGIRHKCNDLPDGLKWRENEGNMCKTMVQVTYLPNRIDGLKHMFSPILLVKRGPKSCWAVPPRKCESQCGSLARHLGNVNQYPNLDHQMPTEKI